MKQQFENERATIDSFNELFNNLVAEHNCKMISYEFTEQQHVEQYGRRRFSSYYSFTNCRKHHAHKRKN